MKHYDQHTLELFFLGSKQVEKLRGEIKRHLSRCEGCRAIAQELEEIYSDASQHLKAREQLSAAAAGAVIRRIGAAPVSVPLHSVPAIPRREAVLQGVRGFVRRHPIVIAAGSFATVAVTAFALGLSFGSRPADRDAASYYYDVPRNMLVVQNAQSVPLWEKPVRDLKTYEDAEVRHNVRFTGLVDFDGDGSNEIVTELPFAPGSAPPFTSHLRAFDGGGKQLFATPLGHRVVWRGQEYPPEYSGVAGIDILPLPGSKEKQILASVPGYHSPTLIARVNSQGRVLGEYWHHGHIKSISLLKGEGSESPRLVIGGTSDLPEWQVGPVIVALLNPLEIRDTTESAATPGYGYRGSDGELVYLRIPPSDIASALGLRPILHRMSGKESGSLRFVVVNSEEGGRGGFEYVFSRDLVIQQVIPLDGTEGVRAGLVKEGRLQGRMDGEYLTRLRESIEYWDGKAWRHGYCQVAHPAAK